MIGIRNKYTILSALLISALLFSGCSKTDASGSAGESSYEAVSADISEFAEKYEEGEADEYFYNVVYDELAYELPVIDDEWLKQDENWMNDDMQYRKLMSAACECEDSLAGLSFDRYQQLYAQSGSEWLGFPSAEGGSSYISRRVYM